MPLLVLLAFNDVRFRHFVVEVVAFAGSFTHTRKHGYAAVQFGNIVDQFHDDDRFADARASERADLAAFEEGADEVNHLDAGDENLWRGRLLHQRRGAPMNRVVFVRLHRALFVHRLPRDVEDATHDGFADGHGDGLSGVDDVVAALESFAGAHGDGAHPIVAQVLLDFEREFGGPAQHLKFDGERVVNGRELADELDVHDRSDDLNDFAFVHGIASYPSPSGRW